MNKMFFILLPFLFFQNAFSQCDAPVSEGGLCLDQYFPANCIINGAGCSDPTALNYFGDECSEGIFLINNCNYPEVVDGCTCPEADNFDSSADVDDGTCYLLTGGCNDSDAINYSGDVCATAYFIDPDCQYESVELGEFSYTVTDANMTIQVGQDEVTFNGEVPPVGSLLGAFFINDTTGELQCAGYKTWGEPEYVFADGTPAQNGDEGAINIGGDFSNGQLAIAVFASETGLNNGFEPGDEFIWGLSIAGESFAADSFVMNSNEPFSTTFSPNGFGQLFDVNFNGELTAIFGCTDSSAINYNSNATFDDASCYSLVWEILPNTDCNMSLSITPEGPVFSNITFNNDPLPLGSLIGAFYINEQGQFICSDYTEWTGQNLNLTVWGAETGEDNGFVLGEDINIFAQIYGQDFQAINSEFLLGFPWAGGTYTCNALGNLSLASFEGEIASILGCTDPTAFNFDENATDDDDSCLPVVYGCTDDSYTEYDPAANTDDDSCSTLVVLGCTDSDYLEYDPAANTDDNTCSTLVVFGCTDDSYTEYDPAANTDDDSCSTLVVLGCTDSDYIEYDPAANTDDNTCSTLVVFGCTDDSYTEYDPAANTDDDSCSTLVVLGCTDSDYLEYDPAANTDDDSCSTLVVLGCTDDSYTEYDPAANTDDDSCSTLVVLGCTDSDYIEYDPAANTDDDSCSTLVVLGCTDDSYTEYDPAANTDDDSCSTLVVLGCTDSDYIEYDPTANTDDDSCSTLVVLGCTDDSYTEYDPAANTDDDSCSTLVVLGCTDDSYTEYDPAANTDDDSCSTLVVFGCTDDSYTEYDPAANTDDDSCSTLVVFGCTDDEACNFNSSVNTDNGSCVFPENGYDCFGELLPIDSPWGNNLGCYPFNTHSIGFSITEDIEEGDYIGLFYTDENGNLVFSHGVEYLGGVVYFNVCGDDETTDEKDGFSEGEEFIWQIFSNDLNCSLPLNVVYDSDQPNQSLYSVNGISEITEISYEQLSLELVLIDIDCYGQNNGLINAIVSGGSGNYTFEWSNGETSQVISNLSSGIYSVVVSDDNGCLVEESQIEIMEPAELLVSGVTNNVSCNGSFDGAIDIFVSGGVGGYSFYWSNGEVTEDLNSLSAGNYSVIVLDSNGCSQTIDFEITEPEAMAISENHSNISCNSGSDGSIDITVSGGTGIYDFSWSNGENSEDISNLTEGTYSVTASDENGCSISIDIDITEPEELSISFSSTPGEYLDCSSGQLSVLAENGTGPYSYLWSNGDTSPTIFGLCSGDYDVVVTDANGCSVSGSAIVDLLIPEGWEVYPTSCVHEIIIPTDSELLFNAVDLNIGDLIGVFFVNSENELSCGGYTIWEGEATSILAYGNDDDVDGFDEGEQFQWKVYNGQTHSGFAIYNQSLEFERYFSCNSPDLNNSALDFSNNNSYVAIPDINNSGNQMIQTNNFTAMCWFNLIGPEDGGLIQHKQVWSNGAGWMIGVQNNSLRIMKHVGDGNNNCDGNSCNYNYLLAELNINQPYHVAWSSDNGDNIIYLNGDSIFNFFEPTSFPNDGFAQTGLNANPFIIGASVDGGVLYSNSIIDQVIYFENSLSSSDIINYMNCPPSVGELGLVGYWNFDDINLQLAGELYGSQNEIFSSSFIQQSCSNVNSSEILGAVSSSFQTIPLNENPYTDWDMISTYMNSNEDIESIMSPILNNFIIIKDGSGLVYWPEIPVSTLDNLNTLEAYAIKTWSPEEINILGDFVQPEFTNNQWIEGWNFISYPRYWSNSVETSLSTVLSDIKLLKDDSGNIFWPELGINTISNMEAGEGYLLKLNNESNFSFHSNSDFFPENPFDFIAPGGSISYEVVARYGTGIENFEFPVSTYQNMTIGFPESSLNVEDGDELAVFDQSGNLVGVSKLQSGNNYIVVWGDDEETVDKDGLLVGEAMSFKLWKKQENKIFNVVPDWSEGDDNFSVNGINIAESVIVENSNTTINSIHCFPNPASSFVNLEFNIENDSKLDVSLVDNLGKLVYSNSSVFNSGVNIITLPLDNVSKGIYYIEVMGVDFVERLKIDVLY